MQGTRLDRDFSQLSLGGTGAQPPSSDASAPMPTPMAESAAARRTARDTHRAAALAALRGVQRLRGRLTGAQAAAVDIAERVEDIGYRHQTNRDQVMVRPGPLNAREEACLARRPSFLKVSPILEDMLGEMPKEFDEMERPATPRTRALLTAQIALIRHQIIHDQAYAIEAASEGDRLKPLPLDTVAFGRFIDTQKPLIRETISACRLPVAERHPRLQTIFEAIGTNYLRETGHLTDGFPPGTVFESQGLLFDHAPVSVVIKDDSGIAVSSVTGFDMESSRIMWLKAGGLNDIPGEEVEPCREPIGHRSAFAGASTPQRLASAYLQQLFISLSGAEEMAESEEGVLDVNNDIHPILGTAAEKTYQGALEMGDDCDRHSMPNQREAFSVPLRLLPLRAAAQQEMRGEPLLLDPALEAWITGPELGADLLGFVAPSHRLQIAQMDAVSQALRNTGLFSGPQNG